MPAATNFEKTGPSKSVKTQTEADARLQRVRRAVMILKHVSDASGVLMILLLAEGEDHIGSIAERLGHAQSTVSHRLAMMRHGGVVAARRQGQKTFYTLTGIGEKLAGMIRTLNVPEEPPAKAT